MIKFAVMTFMYSGWISRKLRIKVIYEFKHINRLGIT